MPRIKSAKKQVRVSEKRRLRNRSVRSQVKTNVTKAEKLILSGELEPSREAVKAAVVSLDKAAEKGIIHGNNTARRKSRLMKKLNQLNQAKTLPLAETERESETAS
ncbi:30S ribosomal protein S20 [Chloroflexota bacterium]